MNNLSEENGKKLPDDAQERLSVYQCSRCSLVRRTFTTVIFTGNFIPGRRLKLVFIQRKFNKKKKYFFFFLKKNKTTKIVLYWKSFTVLELTTMIWVLKYSSIIKYEIQQLENFCKLLRKKTEGDSLRSNFKYCFSSVGIFIHAGA